MNIKMSIPEHQVRMSDEPAGSQIEFDIQFPEILGGFRRVVLDSPLTREKVLVVIKEQYVEALAEKARCDSAVDVLQDLGFIGNTEIDSIELGV